MRRKFKLILFVWILRVIMSVLSYQKRCLRILNIIKKLGLMVDTYGEMIS